MSFANLQTCKLAVGCCGLIATCTLCLPPASYLRIMGWKLFAHYGLKAICAFWAESYLRIMGWKLFAQIPRAANRLGARIVLHAKNRIRFRFRNRFCITRHGWCCECACWLAENCETFFTCLNLTPKSQNQIKIHLKSIITVIVFDKSFFKS